MGARTEVLAEFLVEKSREVDLQEDPPVEMIVICENCCRITCKKFPTVSDARGAKFVVCSFCGRWVRNV